MIRISSHKPTRCLRFAMLLAGVSTLVFTGAQSWRTRGQCTSCSVVTVSAATFRFTDIAPESVVAAFGARLATTVVIAPQGTFPTSLAGTTVEVNKRLAGLIFVSPGQVNYIIPAASESGTLSVVVHAGDGTVSTGTVTVKPVAPAIFTANVDGGIGVPAGFIVRVRPGGQQTSEPIYVFNVANLKYKALPINLGPVADRVYLLLFTSGMRRASPNEIRVLAGGLTLPATFGNPLSASIPNYVSDIPGADIITAELSHTLSDSGDIRVSVTAAGLGSNKVELIFASVFPANAGFLSHSAGPGAPAGPPQVTGFSPSTGLAGQTLAITGANFSENVIENFVRINGVVATTVSASPSQLVVTVPYGAQLGSVSVRTTQGEGISASSLALRTSISGFVISTGSQPIRDVRVTVDGTNIQAMSGIDGSFVLADVPSGDMTVGLDAPTSSPLPFPRVRVKVSAAAGRDNRFLRPIVLQNSTGPQGKVGTLTTGNVSLEIPQGATNTPLTLTLVENARPPVDVPPGEFSTAIVQVTPFGQKLTPGGRLIFPNTEVIAPGTQATLFRLDQSPGSLSLGTFVEAGTATVSADGQRVETLAGAVNENSYYFISATRATTTVTGRVFQPDGATPANGVLVRSDGLETYTDGNGGYILRYVPVSPLTNAISVEAVLTNPNSNVIRIPPRQVPANIRGVTVMPDLFLSSGVLVTVSAADYSAEAVPVEGIVAAFGSGLATGSESALTIPLPTLLAGTSVKVIDSVGTTREAPLFYVSPRQINYQIPPGTTEGPAAVIATAGDGRVSTGTIQVVRVAPKLFTLDTSGRGLAAAEALRVGADGKQSSEPVARLDPSQNKWVSVPIDLGPPSDTVFLILYGTGVRFRSSLSAVQAIIGGEALNVDYAGRHSSLVGLDQLNVRLPRSLIGRGDVVVALTVDGRPANVVQVSFK
jgi:uncharacterized protein (TIGR03437 family)